MCDLTEDMVHGPNSPCCSTGSLRCCIALLLLLAMAAAAFLATPQTDGRCKFLPENEVKH